MFNDNFWCYTILYIFFYVSKKCSVVSTMALFVIFKINPKSKTFKFDIQLLDLFGLSNKYFCVEYLISS